MFLQPVRGISSQIPQKDPHYSNVSCYLRMDGAGGSTTFTDSGPRGVTWQAAGGAGCYDSTPKFGTGFGWFDGINSYIYTGDNAAYNFSSAAFTIEAWIRPFSFNHLSGAPGIYGHRNSYTTSHACTLYCSNAGYLGFTWTTNGTTPSVVSSTNTIELSPTWSHVAATRSGDTIRLFINGAVEHEGSLTGAIFNSTAAPKIGAFDTATWSGSYFKGSMDEFRITKGVARYVTDFVPQRYEWPDN